MKKNIFYTLFILNLIAVFYIWWTGSESMVTLGGYNTTIAFGRLAGLLGQVVLLLQLMLIGRVTWIEQEFGHDKMNKLHRTIGYSVLGLLIFHPVLLTIGYAGLSGVGWWQQFVVFFTSYPWVWLAVTGFILLCFIVTIALPPIRRGIKYEYWYWTHLTIYIVLGILFVHQLYGEDIVRPRAKTYWLIMNIVVWAVFLYFRFIRIFVQFLKHTFYIDRVVPESKDVHSVYIKGKNMNEFRFNAGQFANWTFLAKKFWYTHPFSISTDYNGEHIRISVKNVGDFTSTIKDLQPGTKVIVDGPLGIFTEKIATKNKYLFIAGGIGITPIRAMIGSLSKKNADMILLYGNRTLRETVFKEELASMIKRMHIVLSADTEPGYETGFIDREKIIRCAPDFIERDIYVCGPPVMMNNIIEMLKGMGVPHAQLHYEKFSY
jgi:predicted ferric reductase